MDVKRLGTKLGSAAILAIALLICVQTAASQPVHKFLECYQAVRSSETQMNFWERVTCSLLLSCLSTAQQPGATTSPRNSS